jgi:hypothetical protein
LIKILQKDFKIATEVVFEIQKVLDIALVKLQAAGCFFSQEPLELKEKFEYVYFKQIHLLIPGNQTFSTKSNQF